MSVEKEKAIVEINGTKHEVDEQVFNVMSAISLERDHYRNLALDAGLVPDAETETPTHLSFSQFKKGLLYLISQLFYVLTATALLVIYCVKTGQLELFESFLKNAYGVLYIIIMLGIAFSASILETVFKLSWTLLSIAIRVISIKIKNLQNYKIKNGE